MNGELAAAIDLDLEAHANIDPNGMHRDPSGTWHIYYQYNPLTPVAGNQVRIADLANLRPPQTDRA